MQTKKKKNPWKLSTKLDPVNAVATSSEGCTEVRGITFSSDDNWLKLHARVSSNLNQAEATSKSRIYKARSGSPSLTHCTDAQRLQSPDLQTWSEFPVFGNSYAGRKHKGRDMLACFF